MPANDFISHLKEAPVWAIGAFDSWFFTNAPHPFISTSRRVTSLASLSALEPAGINVFPPAKQRPEQIDFFGGRGGLGERSDAVLGGSDFTIHRDFEVAGSGRIG